MRKFIYKLESWLAFLENSLIVGIVSVLVIFSFFQVFLRNFFDSGILWGDVFLRHMVLWVGFVGASLATREGKHINIDILTRVTPQRFLPAIRVVVNLVTAAICLVLANAARAFLNLEIENNTILFNNVPAWYFQVIIPAGFTVIALRFLLKVFEHFFPRAEADTP